MEARRIYFHDVPISRDLSDALKHLGRETEVPLKSVLLAAHLKTLGLLSGESDVVTGFVTNGRPEQGHGEKLLGLFLNTLPLRINLKGGTWAELIQRSYRLEEEMLPFRWFPLPELQNALNRRPLYESAYNFTHFHVYQGLLELKDVKVLDINAFQETNLSFIVNFSIDAVTSLVRLRFDYDATEFSEEDVKDIGTYYSRTLQAMVDNPFVAHDSDYYLSEEERREIIYDFNPRSPLSPSPLCLHQLFDHQVARSPLAIALSGEAESLTYAELNRRAETLARTLVRHGLAPDERVGVLMQRSPALVVALLGVLKAGGAYLPLDEQYPLERLRFMIEDGGAHLIVTEAATASLVGEVEAVMLDYEEAVSAAGREEEEEEDGSGDSGSGESGSGMAQRVGADNAAYVIYTSGSTGKPKGVVVTHANLSRLFSVTERLFAFAPTDVWTMFHSQAFDFSVWEMWGALLSGGRLVVVPRETSRTPEAFHELLVRERVTVLNQTPSAFRQLMSVDEEHGGEGLEALRVVIFGGEALEASSLRGWVERHGDERPQLVNMYGITETTVHVTYRRVRREEVEQGQRGSGSRIGRALGDMRVYVLDEGMKVVPVGVKGELYVGGGGVARGYLNRGDLSGERFVPDGESGVEGERMYRTGDVGRWIRGGELEYLGRVDEQVKVRGYRIELGEIEATLVRHPAVLEARVLVREDSLEDKRLVAYVVPRPFEIFNSSDVRSVLSETLPAYMIPSAFVVLDRMPLTSNGKLDQSALPAPVEGTSLTEVEFVPPQTEEEEALALIWARLLKVERVGMNDNFFDVGGHSVLATRLISEINKQFQVDVSVRVVFETPTAGSIAKAVQQARAESGRSQEPAIVPVVRQVRRVRRSAT
jgi:amino acid adenylation domain-containing protein